MKELELIELMAKHRIVATDEDGLQKFKAIVCEELEAEGRDVSRETVLNYVPGSWFMAHSVDEMQAFYFSRLDAIRAAARDIGYAIGLHGSTRRDFDLIAVPWRDGYATKDELAAAIQMAACGLVSSKFEWEQKPAGRVAASFPICWAQWEGCHGILSIGHIDLSVMSMEEKNG